MTTSENGSAVVTLVVFSLVICFFVWLNFGDQIKFIFVSEKIKLKNIETHSIEAQRIALYYQKLVKVFNLVVDLNVDEGFHFDLKKKLKDEIRYIENRLQIELGKEMLDTMKPKIEEAL